MSKTFFTCLILTSLFFLCSDTTVFALTPPITRTIETHVTISASLGEPVLRLWGYGPSNSRVELSGRSVSDFTYSRTDGYFEFSKAFLPAPSNFLYPELCLIGIDQTGQATTPNCIPPLPANEYSYDIGPIILPPTLSLEAGSTTPENQVAASGNTIPNSEVKIVLAEGDNSRTLTGFSLVREAKAYYIPSYTVKSDARGYFSFNMPAVTTDKWRVFAITTYSPGATSPKSNTLTFEILSPTLAALENYWKLIPSLLTLPVLILVELIILVILCALIINRGKRDKIKTPTTTSNSVNVYLNYLKSRRSAGF